MQVYFEDLLVRERLRSTETQMGRKPCCSKEGLNRGTWSATEDQILIDYIKTNGEGKWGNVPKEAGLKRCAKSCRLRWLNYLRPGIKRGNISQQEEDLIIRLHKLLGNRWSLIAGRLPGRTDNEIKNYWNSTLGKKVRGEQLKKAKAQSMAETPEFTAIKSTAIRTKASKFSKFLFTQQEPYKAENFDSDKLVHGAKLESPKSDRTPSTTSLETHSVNSTMLGVGVGELLASDISDSELWSCCQLNSLDGTDDAWLSSDQHLQFSEEMLTNWIRDDNI